MSRCEDGGTFTTMPRRIKQPGPPAGWHRADACPGKARGHPSADQGDPHADDHRRACGKCFTDRLRLKLRFGLAASELCFDAGNPITGVPQRLLRGRGDADARPASLTACRPLRTPSRTEGGRASRPWTVCALPSPTGTSADLDAILVRRRGSAGPTPDVGGPNCQGIVPFRQA
jgi:hypothetical protein